ncbi:MAG TPA: hypothetical protein DCM05_09330 [Elusimicrobia bacterium]|nr:hypothetical protein [Elusimicrobiota bacterium]
MNHPALQGPPKVGAGLIVIVLLLGGAFWGRRTWQVTHPVFPTQAVETGTYRASYPAHWEPIDPSDPRLGDKEVAFLNHRSQDGAFEPYDRPRMHMAVKEEGTGFADLDAMAAKMRKDGDSPGPVEVWRLENGLAAKTWVERPLTTDIPSSIRWLAFKGSNGRYYSAAFPVPADWKTRARYEHLFKSILASMEFK